jgi:hypothetical protein
MVEYGSVQKQLKDLGDIKKSLKETIVARIGEHAGVQSVDRLATFKQANGHKVTNWQRIALELNADQEMIDKHTKQLAGSRRLLVKKIGR